LINCLCRMPKLQSV